MSLSEDKLAMESPKSSKSLTGRAAKPKCLVHSPQVVRWSPRHVQLGMVRSPVHRRMMGGGHDGLHPEVQTPLRYV